MSFRDWYKRTDKVIFYLTISTILALIATLTTMIIFYHSSFGGPIVAFLLVLPIGLGVTTVLFSITIVRRDSRKPLPKDTSIAASEQEILHSKSTKDTN